MELATPTAVVLGQAHSPQMAGRPVHQAARLSMLRHLDHQDLLGVLLLQRSGHSAATRSGDR